MMKCSYCGRENEHHAAACSECGTSLQAPRSNAPRDWALVREWVQANPGPFKLGAITLVAGLAVGLLSYYLHRPRLSEAEVLQIANATAATNGFILSEYRAPHVRPGRSTVRRNWVVIYDQKVASPWGPPLSKPHSAYGAPETFMILVVDKTGETRIGIPRESRGGQPVAPPPGVKVLGYYTNAQPPAPAPGQAESQ